MLLIRPLPPIPRAGRRPRAARRFLLIETSARPRIGERRYVFDDLPTVTDPTTMLCIPARLEWDDVEFRAVRTVISAYREAERRQSAAEVGDDEDKIRFAEVASANAWAECQHVAYQVFSPEPQTIRDVFLRAEMLTLHYGGGRLAELLESEREEHRMLGALLKACWKVGGAANV